jgi:hypothetical protein
MIVKDVLSIIEGLVRVAVYLAAMLSWIIWHTS